MTQYTIEPARDCNLEKLAFIERVAAASFPDHLIKPEERASVVSLGQLVKAMQQGCLWVALTQERQTVGFILAALEDNAAFIVEVDVLPEHQGKGLGRALIQQVVEWACMNG